MQSLRFFAAVTFLSALIISCAATKTVSNAQFEQDPDYMKIPIEVDEKDTVGIIFTTDENISLKLMVDSGNPNNYGTLYSSGFKKMSGSEYNKMLLKRKLHFIDNFTTYTGKLLQNYTDSQIEELYKKYDKYIYSTICPMSLSASGYLFSNAVEKAYPLFDFVYNPLTNQDFTPRENDGTIGFSFFQNAKRITINYKEKYIEINGPRITKTAFPLKKNNGTGFYYTYITVNNQLEVAVLDTGSTYTFLREPVYDRKEIISLMENQDLTFQQILDALKKYPLEETENQYNYARKLKFGNTTYSNVKAAKITNKDIRTSQNGRLLISALNNIGAPFFKNKIIQFDFENQEFLITD